MAVRGLPMLFWMGVIFVLSDQPSPVVPVLGPWDLLFKKGAHFLAYAILALLAYRLTRSMPHPYFRALAITAIYAVFDEWHQTFVPTRNGTPMDILIDCAGGLAALLTHRWQQGSFRRS
jgi:VanZ family protein